MENAKSMVSAGEAKGDDGQQANKKNEDNSSPAHPQHAFSMSFAADGALSPRQIVFHMPSLSPTLQPADRMESTPAPADTNAVLTPVTIHNDIPAAAAVANISAAHAPAAPSAVPPSTSTASSAAPMKSAATPGATVPLSQSRYVKGPPSPFERAGWLSLLTVWWASSLIVLGNQRILQEADVPELPDDDTSSVVYDKFQMAWNKTREGGKAGSVWRALFSAFGKLWMIGGVHCVLSNVFAILQPIFVQRLVEALSDDASPILHAYMWSLALVCTTLGSSLFLNQMFTYNIRAANGARVSTLVSIYDKSLRLSRAAKQALATGSVVNIQSNDTSRLFDCILVLHFL